MRRYHVECHTEQALLMSLCSLKRNQIEHHMGSGSVCKTLSKGKNLFGLIDEDPQRAEYQHEYYARLYKHYESDEHKVRFSVDPQRGNGLVFIKPRFEPWLIHVVGGSHLKMADFDLSDDSSKLHGEIKGKLGSLQKLLHKLMKLKNPAIVHLRNLLVSSYKEKQR